ncbi:MAG: GNAT family N-acetyltransferase [Woeseiaceae bacterium]|nr:GNAT family N-acetyltransferase [Woeseiaceae bacterium]
MNIRPDDLTGAAIQDLLAAHLRGMHDNSPPESVHALDLDGLRSADITFWSVWDDADLLGCGALKELDATHGEIKSMRTAERHIGKGVASLLVEHIFDVACERGYSRLSLETGSGPAFEPAHALYLKFGFEFCGPFGNYTDDPFSRFMTREV